MFTRQSWNNASKLKAFIINGFADGAWLAYESNESGQPEVYVQRFPDLGQRVTSRRTYDVSPDGQRFLMVTTGEVDDAETFRIQVVQNWHQELLERVPVP